MKQPLSARRPRDRLRGLITRYALLLAAVGIVVFVSFGAIVDFYTSVRSAEETRSLALSLLRLQIDEQTAVSAFGRTGDDAFLIPYSEALPNIDARVAEIAARVPPESDERAALDRFVSQQAQWQRIYAQPIIVGRTDDLRARERNGKALTSAMGSDLLTIAQLQATRSARARALAQRTYVVTEIVVVLLIFTIAWIGFVMERRAALREEEYVRQLRTERDSAAYIGDWRNKIIAMLAHDFRSALAVIDTSVMLLEDFPNEIDKEQTTTRIHQEVESLASMAETALLMARVASGTIPISKRPVALVPLINHIADRYRHSHAIHVDGPELETNGEESYLVRIFDNLLNNAVKYSDDDKPIVVTVSQADGGATSEVTISDCGPGIDPAHLPFIFEEYWRAPLPNKIQGSGLGLFIVKKLIDAHNGTIEVRSYPGSGTTISVRLPAA